MTPAPFENFLLEALKPAPSLAVLVWIVWQFIKHMRSMESSRAAEAKARDLTLKTLEDNCHAFQQGLISRTEDKWTKVSAALDKNTEALGKNSATLAMVDDRIVKIDSHLRRSGQLSSHPNPTPGTS